MCTRGDVGLQINCPCSRTEKSGDVPCSTCALRLFCVVHMKPTACGLFSLSILLLRRDHDELLWLPRSARLLRVTGRWSRVVSAGRQTTRSCHELCLMLPFSRHMHKIYLRVISHAIFCHRTAKQARSFHTGDQIPDQIFAISERTR